MCIDKANSIVSIKVMKRELQRNQTIPDETDYV